MPNTKNVYTQPQPQEDDAIYIRIIILEESELREIKRQIEFHRLKVYFLPNF